MGKRMSVLIWMLTALCVTAGAASAWTTVGTGIEYQTWTFTNPNNHVYVARMDRNETTASIDTAVAYDQVSGATEIVRNQAAREDGALTWWGGSWGPTKDIVIAINGGFWSWDTSIMEGGQVQNGWYAKWYNDLGAFSGFAWKTDRTPFIGQCIYHNPANNRVYFVSSGVSLSIKGINRARGSNELVLYTPQYNNQTPSQSTGVEVDVEMAKPDLLTSASTYSYGYIRDIRQNTGSTWIPFDHIILSASGDAAATLLNNSSVGGAIRIYQELTDKNQPTTSGQNACQTNTGIDWQNTFAAISSNYHFLENNVIRSPDPNYDGYAGMIIRNPRTCIAYNADYVFFVVCDGRSTDSVGWTSDEMADFCKNTLGATDGVNCDGGGSSTMIVNGVLQNVPSDGSERPTVNSTMMFNVVPESHTQTFSSGQTVTVASAANVRLGPGTNFGIRTGVSAGQTGTVQSHAENGVFAKGFNWWKVSFAGTVGWIAESLLVAPNTPPTITQQPTTQSVPMGGTTTFTVAAAGPGTLTYQWQKDQSNISNGGHFSGATTTSLVISSADPSDAGNYRCVVTNSYGSTNSNEASLTVYTTLLGNGDFESWTGSATADNWTQYNTSGSVACSKGTTFTGTPSVSAHGGSQFQRVKLDASAEQGGVYQRFASTAGTQYTVSAWLLTRLTNASQVEAKVGVDPTGATTPGANTTWSTVVSGDSSWTQRTLNVTATGSYITVFLDGRHPTADTNQCNVFFDDVSAGSSCTPPSPPTGGTAAVDSTSQITWGWTRASGSTGETYKAYDASTGGTLKWTSGSQATSYAEGGLSANTLYGTGAASGNQRHLATCASCESASRLALPAKYTLQANATTPTFGTLTTSSIVLNTTGPVNLTAGSSGVIFKRNATTDLTKVQALTATDSGLTANTSYSYTARGVNGDNVASTESASAAKFTLAKAPTYGTSGDVTVQCAQGQTKTDCTAGQDITFTFNNAFGSGAANVGKFTYKWDTSATWDGTSGTDWTSGSTLVKQAGSAGTSYYLHLRSWNNDSTKAENTTTLNLGPYTVPAAQRLVNIGFETWSGSVTADNWTQYNKTGTVTCYKGTTFTGTPSVSAHGGSQFQRVKLDSNNEEGGVYQRFVSTVGQQYTVSAWLLTRLTSTTSAEAKLGVDPTGATVPGANTVWSSTVTGDSAWTQRTLTVTATGGYITVFMNGRHPTSDTNQCNVFFDDASAL
jgi:hypothetical protein